jgi:trk system potassium uptake protein TrkA
MKRSSKRSALVVGMGRFGSAAAERLVSLGWDVVGVDSDPRVVQEMRDRVGHVLELNASDEEALAIVGVPEFDVCIVSGASTIETSILIVLNLQSQGAKYIVAKSASEYHGRILRRLEVDNMIYPERDAGIHLAESLQSPHVVEWIDLDENQELAAVRVPPHRVGQSLGQWRELLRPSLQIVARLDSGGRKREGEDDTPLQAGEKIVVVGPPQDILSLGQ